MEFVQEGTKDYSEDPDEDDHQEGTRETSNFFPNCSDYSSKYSHPWLHDAQDSSPSSSSSRSTNYNQLMDLSLGGSGKDQDGGDAVAVQREHMFDKVVTPSDVGKLNRLVIPKQHAERYFPLDSTTNDKGLLLNFEDRTGKPWRFRYSYWNSSQSYVMTKGWSRFVKEKKLDAGDIVSFHRGLGDHAKDRLFIDWRRRPQTPLPTSLRWASARLYSLPQPLMPPPPPHYPLLPPPPPHLSYNPNPNPNPNYHYHHPYHRQLGFSQQHHHLPDYVINSVPEPVYYLRSSSSDQYSSSLAMQQSGGHVPMVIDSVPLLHGRTAAAAGKNKLRLFGVNMECDKAADGDDLNRRVVLPSTAVLPHVSVSATASMSPQFSEKGKSTLSFDLDL